MVGGRGAEGAIDGTAFLKPLSAWSGLGGHVVRFCVSHSPMSTLSWARRWSDPHGPDPTGMFLLFCVSLFPMSTLKWAQCWYD